MSKHTTLDQLKMLAQRTKGEIGKRFLDRFATIVSQRTEDNFKRSNRRRPDNALVIIILFNSRTHNTSDADSITTHLH